MKTYEKVRFYSAPWWETLLFNPNNSCPSSVATCVFLFCFLMKFSNYVDKIQTNIKSFSHFFFSSESASFLPFECVFSGPFIHLVIQLASYLQRRGQYCTEHAQTPIHISRTRTVRRSQARVQRASCWEQANTVALKTSEPLGAGLNVVFEYHVGRHKLISALIRQLARYLRLTDSAQIRRVFPDSFAGRRITATGWLMFQRDPDFV